VKSVVKFRLSVFIPPLTQAGHEIAERNAATSSAFIRVIRGKIRMPDENLTVSATFNRFESLFVPFVTFCKMDQGSNGIRSNRVHQ
jgi:hypothetical protein